MNKKRLRPLFKTYSFTLSKRSIVEGANTLVTVKPGGKIVNSTPEKARTWTPKGAAGTGLPEYITDIPTLQAAHDIAIDELLSLLTAHNTLLTGENWPMIWTRDTAYATQLSLALINPYACMQSMKERVFDDEILQDTGTGGAWPVSSDRIVWALAAWEIFLSTGDLDWLQWCTRVLAKTVAHDEEVLVTSDGLIRGETSYLDWREQSYPAYMNPCAIAQSVAHSTMVLHYSCRQVLADMYRALGNTAQALHWRTHALSLHAALDNSLWMPTAGHYGQYLYGFPYPVLSERIDSLATALSVLFGAVSDKRAISLVDNIPHTPYGTPCFNPQISEIESPYHNRTLWPFVQAYVGLAAAHVTHSTAFAASLAYLIRASLVCGSHKENINIETGRDDTALSSDAQLWSIAGMLGMIYKGLFGITQHTDRLSFQPCLPRNFQGKHKLKGLKWRNLTLDITLQGSGTEIDLCTINRKKSPPLLMSHQTGHYSVVITLSEKPQISPTPIVPVKYDLPIPRWRETEHTTQFHWHSVPGATSYTIYRNGMPLCNVTDTYFSPASRMDAEYLQVQAINDQGGFSFLSEPKERISPSALYEALPVQAEEAGVHTTPHSNASVFFAPITIAEAGVYSASILFANGIYGLDSGNTCGLRSLYLNGKRLGSMAFPHITTDSNWAETAYSQAIEISLSRGVYHFELRLGQCDYNMNRHTNDFLIKSLKISRIGF